MVLRSSHLSQAGQARVAGVCLWCFLLPFIHHKCTLRKVAQPLLEHGQSSSSLKRLGHLDEQEEHPSCAHSGPW